MSPELTFAASLVVAFVAWYDHSLLTQSIPF
jgi:hypothetical protein